MSTSLHTLEGLLKRDPRNTGRHRRHKTDIRRIAQSGQRRALRHHCAIFRLDRHARHGALGWAKSDLLRHLVLNAMRSARRRREGKSET